ncbi:TorD/DmsD family molecular chaperone [Azospirillum endophyticum]
MESTVLEAPLSLSHQDGDGLMVPPCSNVPGSSAPGTAEMDSNGAAQALRLLAHLHAEQPTPALVARLRHAPLSHGPLALDRDDALQAAALVDEVLSDLPERVTRRSLSPLAADFAAIHGSGELRACPTEAPWLDEKARADAGASLLRWRTGLETDLRRPPLERLPDDHIAAELALLAALIERGRTVDTVLFLDRHPLRWVPDFCSRVATRCREPFFAGIAVLTNAHLDDLRDRLGAACGMPRPDENGPDLQRRRRWTEGRFPRTCACDP